MTLHGRKSGHRGPPRGLLARPDSANMCAAAVLRSGTRASACASWTASNVSAPCRCIVRVVGDSLGVSACRATSDLVLCEPTVFESILILIRTVLGSVVGGRRGRRQRAAPQGSPRSLRNSGKEIGTCVPTFCPHSWDGLREMF